jgi:hypothetical protein
LKYNLALKPIGRSGDGPVLLDEKAHVYQYEVIGLPPGEKGFVAEGHLFGKWEILRVKGGVSGNWTGEHESSDDALVVLQREVDSETIGMKV